MVKYCFKFLLCSQTSFCSIYIPVKNSEFSCDSFTLCAQNMYIFFFFFLFICLSIKNYASLIALMFFFFFFLTKRVTAAKLCLESKIVILLLCNYKMYGKEKCASLHCVNPYEMLSIIHFFFFFFFFFYIYTI